VCHHRSHRFRAVERQLQPQIYDILADDEHTAALLHATARRGEKTLDPRTPFGATREIGTCPSGEPRPAATARQARCSPQREHEARGPVAAAEHGVAGERWRSSSSTVLQCSVDSKIPGWR
jgi:hypothetical protein